MNLRVGLQKVRSFSPSEEKHCSTYWSDTPSTVDGFHLGLWSLSTNTANTRTKKYPFTSFINILVNNEIYSLHMALCCPCTADSYQLVRPHKSRSLSAKTSETKTFLITNTNVLDNYSNIQKWSQSALKLLISYHAGLAQPILHHQHVLQAQRRARLQLLMGDFQGSGRHLGQRLEEETERYWRGWFNYELMCLYDKKILHIIL